MCFSPEASFTRGIILTDIGLTTIKTIQVPSKTLFASIPLVFGIQQLSEGFVWLSLQDPAYAGVQQSGKIVREG